MEGKQAECQSPKTSDHLRFQATEMISGVVAAPFPSFQRRAAAQRPGWLVKAAKRTLFVGIYSPLLILRPIGLAPRARSAPLRNETFLLKPSSDRKRKLLYLGTRFAQQFAFLSHGEEKQPRKNNQ